MAQAPSPSTEHLQHSTELEMRITSLLAVVSAALTVSAIRLPFGDNYAQQETFTAAETSTLPESGSLVSTPLAFNAEGEDDFFVFEGGEMSEAMFDDWKTTVVNSHNKFRAKYGAPNLSWSDSLYGGTQQWASQCKFQHRWALSLCVHPRSFTDWLMIVSQSRKRSIWRELGASCSSSGFRA